MRKLIFALSVFMLGLNSVQVAVAQKKSGGSSIERNALLESSTGLMVYNVYNNNNLLMDLFDGKLINKNEALKQAVNLENTLDFVISQVDRVLNADVSDMKNNEVRYYRDLKKTMVVLQKQAISLKDHINGVSGAKGKFNTFKELAWKQVTNVMSKQS